MSEYNLEIEPDHDGTELYIFPSEKGNKPKNLDDVVEEMDENENLNGFLRRAKLGARK